MTDDGTMKFATEAGRRLAAWSAGDRPVPPDDWLGAILEIEAEATAAAEQRLLHALKIVDAAETEPRTWPSRVEVEAMDTDTLNAFLASRGLEVRVVSVPSPRDPAPDVPPVPGPDRPTS